MPACPTNRSPISRTPKPPRTASNSEFRKLLDQTDEGDLLVFYFCRPRRPRRRHRRDLVRQLRRRRQPTTAPGTSAASSPRSRTTSAATAPCCWPTAATPAPSTTNAAAAPATTATRNWPTPPSLRPIPTTPRPATGLTPTALLAGFRGESQVDLNGDGIIELNELAHYTDLELAFLEGQKSMFCAATAFPRAAKLAWVEDEAGARASASGSKSNPRAAGTRPKIIDVDGDQVEVHYAGFDDNWDEWVGPDRTRPYQPAQFAEGDKVEVQWQQRPEVVSRHRPQKPGTACTSSTTTTTTPPPTNGSAPPPSASAPNDRSNLSAACDLADTNC